MNRYKKIVIRLSVFALSFLFGMSIARVANGQSSSVLWKVEGKGMAQPSYLMGTIHLLCADELKFSQTLKNAIAQSGQLYLELDFDDPDMINELQGGIVLSDGKNLSDLLSKEEISLLGNYLEEKMGASVETVSTIKPFFIMSMLYPQFLGCPTVSMETELVSLAKENGLEVYGLETVEEELAALDKIPLNVQADLLLETISDPDGQMEELNTMRKLYHDEDIDGLYKFTSEGFDQFDGYSEIILDKRNQNWIPVMLSAMKERPGFFAVGAAHLGGPQGVISLLQLEGYTVTAMKQEYEPKETVKPEGTEAMIARGWRIHESQLSEMVDMVIETILENNPGAEEQILAQRGIIESMVENTVKTYNPDGTYVITIPNNPSQKGSWSLDEDKNILIETDAEGKTTNKFVKEVSAEKLVLINEEGEEKVYAALN